MTERTTSNRSTLFFLAALLSLAPTRLAWADHGGGPRELETRVISK